MSPSELNSQNDDVIVNNSIAIQEEEQTQFLGKMAPNIEDNQSAVDGCRKNSKSFPKNVFMCFSLVSVTVVRFVERLCGLWALQIAKHPVIALIGSLLVVIIFGSGLIRLNLVFRPYDLWVPQDSEFSQVTEWKMKNFPRLYREQVAIFEAPNVLSPEALHEMYKFRSKVAVLEAKMSNKSITWDDVCFKIPVNSEWTEESEACYEASVFELWGYDKPPANVTNISEDLRQTTVSKVFGISTNFSLYLGGIMYDDDGRVVGARSAVHTWLTRIDTKAIERGEFEIDVGTGEKVDLEGLAWEKALVSLTDEWRGQHIKVTLRVGHSLGYTLHNAMAKDALWIGVGWTALIIYVFFTLGKPFGNPDEQRIMPSAVGLLAVAMAVLSSYGICSMFGVPYGTLNNVIPVLLVALGVDDMYVIVTAWNAAPMNESVERRAQVAMERAGMAITITSLTNIVAFLVGTTTALPGLRWFCIYAASGIAMIYFLQTTLFVAAMVINERWMNSRKLKKGKSSYEINKHNKPKRKLNFTMKRCMKSWSRCLELKPTKGIVLSLTLFMFLFSVFNATYLTREFDTLWLVPKSSTIYKWYHLVETVYPHFEEKGIVFFKGATFPDDLDALNKLSKDLSNLPDIYEVTSWFDEIDFDEIFREYPWLRTVSPSEQCDILLQHLGFAKLKFFRIVSDPTEDETEHPCSTFRIEFQYVPPETFEEKQKSMDRIRNLVKESQVHGYKGVWAHVYGHWETDRIILKDLFKSLAVVLCVVMLTSIVLLASMRAAFFVLLCVIGTLTNVASSLYFLDLTVNTVTGIAFVLAVGICVDYAAHICHGYLSSTADTRAERTRDSLTHMGGAVFHGGLSTCITFVLLGPSDSYVYVAYFKILTCVSLFGLYHALIFLPTILTLFGPAKKIPLASCTRKELGRAINDRFDGATASGSQTTASTPLGRPYSSMPNFTVLLNSDKNSEFPVTPVNNLSQKPLRHSLCWTNI